MRADIAAREQYLRRMSELHAHVREHPHDYEAWGAIRLVAHRIYAETPDPRPLRYTYTGDGKRMPHMILMPLREVIVPCSIQR